jgi:histidine ammonia-lyase
LGEGTLWTGEGWCDATEALAKAGLTPPPLLAKDAMALINHSGLTVTRAAMALSQMQLALKQCQHAAVLSCEGFGANADIFESEINALRHSNGQHQMATWFRANISVRKQPHRVQDALRFRTLAPVMGAAPDALASATRIWEAELNGASDNPAVLKGHAMRSTPNFSAPALALALEQVSLAMAMVATGCTMRVQRMMNPDLTGLPRYLTPVGGASAGFVPLQKTAAALLADIRRHATPVVLDPAPVSDGVEDMAPMTAQAAAKLEEQANAIQLLAGVEAVVAAQARDLRELEPTQLHQELRKRFPVLKEDRALGQDVTEARDVLAKWCVTQN